MTPIQSATTITPDDMTELSNPCLGFIVNGAGTVAVDMIRNGTNIQFNCLVGIVYPFRVTKIYATGTSATGITVLY